MRFLVALLLSLLATPAFAQLSVPKEVEPYSPIVAECTIPAAADSEVKVTWRGSSDAVKFEQVAGGAVLHIWAPPGDHWIEGTIATQTFRELVVLVPDPANPTDLSKAKAEKVKIALGFSINRHVGNFKVKGAAPAPTPVVPVVPVPVVDIPTVELQTIFAPVKENLSKGDPAKVAVWGAAWSDFLFALKTSEVPKTSLAFIAACKAFMNAAGVKGGLQGAFPGYTAAMDKAFADHFGTEDKPIDARKAIDFTAAAVWACSK